MFKSEAQRRWGNSPAGKKALGGQAAVNEWNAASKGKKLPEVVKPTHLREADFRAKMKREQHG